MKTLPDELEAYRQTPVFSESTIPSGLLKAHTTKAGSWAVIRVLEGQLLYRILEPQPVEIMLDPTLPGVIEPGVRHEVAAAQPVKFYVEFFRRRD